MSDLQWTDLPDEVKWVDDLPGEPEKRGTMLNRFAEALSRRPGKWAVYRRGVKSAGITSVMRQHHPELEWTHRHRAKGVTIYARWPETMPDPKPVDLPELVDPDPPTLGEVRVVHSSGYHRHRP